MAFNITVDEYEVLTIEGGYIFAKTDTSEKNPKFVFQFGNATTAYESEYYDTNTQKSTSLFNVVIKMHKGTIEDITWDNDCWDCGFSDNCVTYENIPSRRNASELYEESNCMQQMCDINNQTAAFECDPKFYVTWFGTDADGTELQSSQLSMSRFKKYSIGSLFSSAKGVFNDTLDTVKNTYDDVVKDAQQIVDDNFR
eukprot:CAMPEP_0170515314 /NCGR_PEP_ID=MMETSP0209-20121228/1756_1 /TAXON_ID=665100 ORGANISM="Litonotus pictus, Strain P1" /NCGR_SAMPLE_ID=MMETSP0209 /ASSEMBLY_ACC=CAM_ASM_000301 /LENGTH=197 /DNA_ID=CAMNT_0010799737 /DNA_START=315 /DNA_END=908 /DNA_ORIENTATION=+